MYIIVSNTLANTLDLVNPVPVIDENKDGYLVLTKDGFNTRISHTLVQEVLMNHELETDESSIEQTVKSLGLTELLQSKIKLNVNPSANLLKRLKVDHRTHYIKLTVDENISLRYYLTFDDRPGMVGKWWLWNHTTKEMFELTKPLLKSIIQLTTKAEEVIGRRLHKNYQKLITDLSTGIVTVGE